MYHPCDLKTTVLSELLPVKFDVILIDPPMEEYLRRAPFKADTATWTWDEIVRKANGRRAATPMGCLTRRLRARVRCQAGQANLRIEDISAPKSVVFLWVGSAEGLDEVPWGAGGLRGARWVRRRLTGPLAGLTEAVVRRAGAA